MYRKFYKLFTATYLYLNLFVFSIDSPQIPEIKLNSTWSSDTLTNTKTVKIICKSATGFAAPLYYQPDLNYTWLLPVPVDSPGFTVKNYSQNYIIQITINCNKETSLPVYCRVVEDSMWSTSAGWYPHKYCSTSKLNFSLLRKCFCWVLN